MNDDSRSDGAVVIAGVFLFLLLFGGVGGAWFLWSKQQLVMQQALQAEERARAMAEVARAEAEVAQRAAIEAEREAESQLAAIANSNAAAAEVDEASLPLGPLRWMVGSWTSVQEAQVVEEFWKAPRGGMMIGLNQSTRESQKPFYEYLRMEVTDDGSIVYFASPMGRDETPFAVKELSDQAVVFENLDNEFPQRIIYRREGDQLKALIEGVRSDGQTLSQQWDFQLLPHR